MGIEIDIDPNIVPENVPEAPFTVDQATQYIQQTLENPNLFNIKVNQSYEFSYYEFAKLIAESLPENMLTPQSLLLLDYRYFANEALEQEQIPEQVKTFLLAEDVLNQMEEGLINQYANSSVRPVDVVREQWPTIGMRPVRLEYAPNAAVDQMQGSGSMGGQGGTSFYGPEDIAAATVAGITQALGGNQSRAYSDDDFVQLFQFDANWQNSWNTFMAQQERGYFPIDDPENPDAEPQPLYKFNWEIMSAEPAVRMSSDPYMGPTGVLGIRNRVRNMSPEELQVLTTKMHMAGIFEDIGGYPDRAFSGSDQFIQLGLDRLMYLSIEQGGIGLEEVLRRRTDSRRDNLMDMVQNANISTVQETLRSIGVNVLGRPLTQEESLQILASLEELAPEFAEAQLGKGVTMEEIVTDIETVDEEEMVTYSRLVEDMFKQQASNFRGYNRTRSIGDYLRGRDRGGSAAADVGYAPSAFEASVETVADIEGTLENG